MGKVEEVKKLLGEGRKDFEKMAEETGASLATVKTQWYKWKKENVGTN